MARRIVVATSPVDLPKGTGAPQLVGILGWTSPEVWNTVIVKARVDAFGRLLRPETMLARPRQADPLRRPVDFVPMKTFVDVMVLGHFPLEGQPGAPVRASGTLNVAGEDTVLDFAAAEPSRVPFIPSHVRIVRAPSDEQQTWPDPTHDGAVMSFEHPMDFPWEIYQAGNRFLARDAIPEGSPIVLTIGLQEPIRFLVPAISPRVLVDPTNPLPLKEVAMTLDTVVVDLDRRELELTWRGMTETINGPADVDRILLGWSSTEDMKDPEEGWPALLREMPHGSFEHAWTFTDADQETPPPPLDEDEMAMARYETWEYPLAPEPRLDVDTYAAVTAEIAHAGEPRETILGRYQLDEYRWGLEERAWTEKIASESRAGAGEPPIAKEVGDAIDRHYERAAPSEPVPDDLRSYADVRVRLEQSDASKVLKEEKLSLGAWFRWDRTVARRAESDPAVSAELERLLKERRDAPEPEVEEPKP